MLKVTENRKGAGFLSSRLFVGGAMATPVIRMLLGKLDEEDLLLIDASLVRHAWL